MVWGVIAYDTRSPLILILGTMPAQQYIYDILQSHVLPLMTELPGVILNKTMLDHIQQGYHKTASVSLPPFPGLLDLQICHQSSISRIIWDGKLDILRVWSN
ncbi:uncharacterized protein TNCV_1494261 [Trichonephila clavipes]|nr:uncharacterized protein TNCV_1494261 [Trichonephila clavipes]